MRSYVEKVQALVWKDVAAELRTREMLTSMFVFAILVIVVFNFAFELKVDNTEAVAPGVLWVAIVFAGMLGLNRSFIGEKDKGCMEGLLLCPVDRSAIYVGKMLGNVLFMLTMEIIVLPIFSAFFNLSVFDPRLLLIVVLGTFGFAGVGTLFAAVAVHTKTREVMLPVLLLPVAVPVLVAAVKATGEVIAKVPPTAPGPWMGVLVGFDVIFLTVAFLTFEYVFQE
ncbi:MAG TPA: heme exporter protein CcmB [Chloroflexota bacterium]